MLLKELLRLRRDDQTGAVPIEVLRRLSLPMPDDVLQQLLADHGVDHDFQRQYGGVDPHALEWRRVNAPAAEIIACSVFAGFREYFDMVRGRTLKVPERGWDDVVIREDGKRAWQTDRTWLRAPLFIRGRLVGSRRPLHLIEGHTRVGALKGLIESGWLPGDGGHEIWLAEKAAAPSTDTAWRDVLQSERMSFADWLIDRSPLDGDLGRVGSALLSAKCKGRLPGSDLPAVLAFIAQQPGLASLGAAVRKEHKRWERETSK